MRIESNIFQEYKALRESALGKNLIEWVESEYDRLIDKASKCDNPTEAFGYIKTAYGIIMIKEHINLMAEGDSKK